MDAPHAKARSAPAGAAPMTPAAVYRAAGLAAALAVAALVAQQLLTLVLVVLVVIIVALPLSAAASAAERRGLPRAVGASAALTAAFAVLMGLGFAVLPEFVSEVRQFAQRLPAILSRADRYVHGLTGRSTRSLSSQLSGFIDRYVHHPARLAVPAEHVGLTLAEILLALLVIIVAAFLIAINPTVLVESFLRLIPPARRPVAEDVMRRVRVAWLGWMAAVGLDMLVLGALLFAGLELVGLNFAIGFAVFSAFMTVIPNYGSVISAIPPIIAALAVSPGKAVLVLIVYLVVNQIEGNLILPLIMARTVDMHPGVVALGLLVVAALFGLIGVLIAIPLLSLAAILIETLWIEPQEARAEREQPGRVTATAGSR